MFYRDIIDLHDIEHIANENSLVMCGDSLEVLKKIKDKR